MTAFIASMRQIWLTMRSNKYFVAFEGGVTGAMMDFAYDALTTGHLNFGIDGVRQLIIVGLSGGVTAVRLLYRAAPGSNPNQK
jgi:hypothetical protein